MNRYRSTVSSATRLEKIYIKKCLERENDGEGKGLQPLDAGFHLLRTKKGLRGEIERMDRVHRSEFRLGL